MSAMSWLQQLAGSRVPRRIADSVVNFYGRRRTAYLNRASTADLQKHTLLNLLRDGRQTRFGSDHDFGRIRTVGDYQARVPLREYEAFWQEYWQPTFPFPLRSQWEMIERYHLYFG